MARKAKVYNWEAIKALYLQGVTYSSIAQQMNVPMPTLKKHIIVNRWVNDKMDLIQARREAGEPEPLSREVVSRRYKQWFIDDAAKVMRALESHDPSGLELKELEQRESVVKSLYSRVSGQLGWDNEAEGGQNIRGNLLAQLAAEITQQREIVLDRQSKSKVIDVQAVSDGKQAEGREAVIPNACCASTVSAESEGEKHAFSGEEPAGG